MEFRGMSRSQLFLIELIIAVLFFSFAGAVTVQVFSKASELAQKAEALNGAVIAAQTAAETQRTVPFRDIDPDGDTVYFDDSWTITEPSKAVYTMTTNVVLEKREAGAMAVYHFEVKSADEIIWQLQTKKYYTGESVDVAYPGEVN